MNYELVNIKIIFVRSTPKLPAKKQQSWTEQENQTMNTSNYVSQDTADLLSETRDSRGNVEHTSHLSDQTSKSQMDEGNSVAMDENSLSQSTVEDMSRDETVTENCSCSKMSIDDSKDHMDSTVNKTISGQSDTTGELRGTFTNHDRDTTKEMNMARKIMEHAESTRECIDINDTQCTSTPRKVKENTITTTNVEIKDDGLIYTKIQPRNRITSLTGNAIQLEDGKKNDNGHYSGVNKSKLNSFNDGESFNQVDASRDSGISEGTSFTSSMSRSESSLSRHSSEKNRPTSPRSSSLSNEARQWLGKRGIRIGMDSEDEGNYTGKFCYL